MSERAPADVINYTPPVWDAPRGVSEGKRSLVVLSWKHMDMRLHPIRCGLESGWRLEREQGILLWSLSWSGGDAQQESWLRGEFDYLL